MGRTTRRRSLLFAAASLLAWPARAQQPDTGDAGFRHHSEYLVGTEWLAAHLESRDVVVLHVGRTDSAYWAGHIPGARFLPLSAVATTVRGIPNEFPPRGYLVATFRDLGVGDSARIVIYGDDPGLLAARAWVALDLLGQSGRTSILDGGLARWTAERRPTATDLIMSSPEAFTARWQGDRIVDATWVRAHLGDSSVMFVDARPSDQYAGAEPGCQPGPTSCTEIPAERRGHLPGAKSLFWMGALVSREDPVLKPMHFLHEEFWKPTGADRPGVRTIVTYCRTGMQASHTYFVARYLGYPDVRLYDGSFIEWSALTPAADYPVERRAP